MHAADATRPGFRTTALPAPRQPQRARSAPTPPPERPRQARWFHPHEVARSRKTGLARDSALLGRKPPGRRADIPGMDSARPLGKPGGRGLFALACLGLV